MPQNVRKYKDVIGTNLKTQEIQVVVKKWDHLKLKSFCSAKETNGMKENLKNEKNISICAFDKQLLIMPNKLQKLNSTQMIKNWH
jgi:hypothetical protein